MLVDIYNMTEYFDVTENLESQGSLKKTILILTFIEISFIPPPPKFDLARFYQFMSKFVTKSWFSLIVKRNR